MTIDLEAIRARDAQDEDVLFRLPVADRRALLAYVDELREAAGKVIDTYDAYRRRGVMPAPTEYADVVRAIDFELRRLLGESHEAPHALCRDVRADVLAQPALPNAVPGSGRSTAVLEQVIERPKVRAMTDIARTAMERAMSDTYEATALFLCERVIRLQAENAALRKDAVRYRWLVENTKYLPWSRQFPGLNSGTGLDEAIDAAMGASHE